ncbi:MAG: NERD domain-containing protein [Kiritimatiellae bacterium]|jgi:restriction system protein|nr:NERD domain-containing protein [Kiritimatiellia bacterium]
MSSNIITFVIIFVVVQILVLVIKKLKSPQVKGWFGEFMVKNVSFLSLPSSTYIKLNDVTIPNLNGGTTQIDHIVISVYGIFVIETKYYKGWIYGSENEKNWTQKNYKKTNTFYNPLKQNDGHVKALVKHLGLPKDCMFPMVIFGGDAEFKSPNKPANVFMTGGAAVHFIKRQGIEYLTHEQCQKIKEQIENISFANTKEAKEQHINYVNSREEYLPDVLAPETRSESPVCSRCGSGMVKRTAKRGANEGGQFWGCSQYPKCRNIINITVD